MQVRSLVGGAARLCGPTTTLAQAAEAMISAETGSLGVVDEGRLAGIVTERDVMRAVASDADPAVELVAAWMTPDPDTVSPDTSIDDAAAWMLAAGYRHVPVMDGRELLGIASIKDVLWALQSMGGADGV